MKKNKLYWLIPIIVAVLYMAVGSEAACPIKIASEKLAVSLISALDTAGLPNEVPDSAWVQTWSDNGTSTRYEARSATYPFSAIGIDTAVGAWAGLTNIKYFYNPTISDIDGTAGNFQLSGIVTLFTDGIPTETKFCVQVVADSLAKAASLVTAYVNATISSRSTFTEAQLWSMLDSAYMDGFRDAMGDTFATFGDTAALARSVFDNDVVPLASRTVNAAQISGDGTAADNAEAFFDGTGYAGTNNVIPSVTNVTTVSGLANNSITAASMATDASTEIWNSALATGTSANATVTTIHDGIVGGVVLRVDGTDDDSSFTNLQAAVASIVGGSGWSGYPYIQVVTTVDAAGTTATRQFVVDSTSLGGANENGLVNKAITIKSDGAGLYLASGIIERVNCVAANCTLQVADALPYSVTSGDSIWIWGAEPAYVIATMAEAAAVNADSTLDRNLTGLPQDSTVSGFLKSGGAGGADSTANKAMLVNMGLKRMIDSTDNAMETATADGFLRRGEVPSTRAVAESVSVVVITEDSARYPRGGRVTFADTTLFADTLGSQVASSSEGSGGCPDSVGYAVTLVAYDSLAIEPVQSAQMALRSTVNGIDLAVSSLTGVSGAYTFTIATPGTYYVITRAAGMTFPVRTLVVSGAQTDTVNGAGYTVSGHAIVVGSVDCYWCDVRFVLESSGQPVTDTSTGLLVTQTVVDTTTNSFGDFTMGLPKTGNMVYMSGTVRKHPQWRVKVSPTDVEKEVKWEKPFDIPADSTAINLRYVR